MTKGARAGDTSALHGGSSGRRRTAEGGCGQPALFPGAGIAATYDVIVEPCSFESLDVSAYLDTDQAGDFTSNTVTIHLFDFECEAA